MAERVARYQRRAASVDQAAFGLLSLLFELRQPTTHQGSALWPLVRCAIIEERGLMVGGASQSEEKVQKSAL